jgi:hypothetical protein
VWLQGHTKRALILTSCAASEWDTSLAGGGAAAVRRGGGVTTSEHAQADGSLLEMEAQVLL